MTTGSLNAEAVHPGTAPAETASRALVGLAGDCAALRLTPLSQPELLEFLDDVHTAQQLLQAAVLHAVQEAGRRGIPADQGAPSARAWLRGVLRISPGAAGRLLAQAEAVDRNPALDAAVADGRVNAEQLAAITMALTELPDDLHPQIRGEAAATLADWAPQLDPIGLRTAGRRILHHVAPDIAEAVEGRWLHRQEREAHAHRHVTLSPLGDGRVRLRGILDSEAAAIVSAALDPLCKPDSATGSAATSSVTTGFAATSSAATGSAATGFAATSSAATGSAATSSAGIGVAGVGSAGIGVAGTGSTAGSAGIDFAADPASTGFAGGRVAAELATTGETRTPGQRRADALVEVCRLILSGGALPGNGGDRPQIAITVEYDVLRQQLRSGTLDSGEPVSVATVRRLACDARVLPLILDGDGQILDAGRTRRTATGTLRQALNVRDAGCTFPGCDRPARWCDAHHIVSWADGGPTDIANLTLLCGHHHRLVHDDAGWQIRVASDGRPEFLPPSWLDQERRPRRNQYHRRT
ncbi:hypothetical protein FHR83_007143 [Actinoplanes campanulatus]|uniref:HNH nuclease domain-containing protein n=2 Tax=Actinoplanes campanulatus TaxID=113559 RepID=A0A7W5ANA5_9ACTN|nr:HNH endonuclease signature motif containing protein [Actinoplanes campanulatus]MBB3099436.1 hypothetical protein [Actinoplanes campanulatus]GGN42868.1 hypothetical protein GCM10010109_74450 [Actinoplanes campanulatus]GID39784.1 hypothetical protein Aca09nite_62900 [Actinoplanes campanulatus]